MQWTWQGIQVIEVSNNHTASIFTLTFKFETVYFCKTFAAPYQTTRCSIVQSTVYIHCGNFKCQTGCHLAPFLTPAVMKGITIYIYICRSQWPRSLRRRSAAARLLRSWVRIPLRAWIFVSCECCVLSGRGLCNKLITRQKESYRLWCVIVCDLETSRMRRP